MKIEDLLIASLKSPAPSAARGERDKFAQLLSEALAQRTSETKTRGLSGPAPVVSATPGEATRAAQEMVETVLSRLEIFQEGLTRPGLALKALYPLVQALEADSQRLLALSQTLPAGSPLRQLVEEVAALTWTESFKFSRGDYL